MLRPREAVRICRPTIRHSAAASGLRLDFNENTVGCSPRVLERIAQYRASKNLRVIRNANPWKP